MYSSKEVGNPSYPTQWALNPSAYQNVDSNSVDWAALAQQWIAMKDAAAIMATPTPPSKPDTEEGEAPMEVENPDAAESSGPEWNASTNSWGSWNQWVWAGWAGPGVDPKMAADPSMAGPPMVDGYTGPTDTTAPMPGYTTGAGAAPTFQHGYWTAPQPADQQSSSRDPKNRDRRSKSRNREHKSSRGRAQRDKPPPVPLVPPVIEPVPAPVAAGTIDAAKRRQLPAWIREGLEKMEREKQKAIEREQEKKAREEAEKEKKRLEEEELERMKAEAGGQPMLPPKSKFESDSEGESDKEEDAASLTAPEPPRIREESSPESSPRARAPPLARPRQATAEPEPIVKKSKDEIMQEVMMTVRRSLTEILLQVTDAEIRAVCQEEVARYAAAQASRLNAMKASKSRALAAIADGLGLGAYESSSSGGSEDEQDDISDQQLQDMIRRRKAEFEKTSREIDEEVRRAELREADSTAATPDRDRRDRSSETPPPVESDTPEKISEHRVSRDRRNSHKSDSGRKLDPIPEEKSKRSGKRDSTPSTPKHDSKKENSSTSSDSEQDSSSSSSSSSSESEADTKAETKKAKKRKRSTSSESRKKSKKEKHKKEKSYKTDDRDRKSQSRSRHYDDYDRSEKKSKRRDDYYDRNMSRSRDYERSHKDKYRDESDEDRPRKRSRRSRSASHSSRSSRRRRSPARRRSRDRGGRSRDRGGRSRDRAGRSRSRDHDKYDRYERSREHDRRSPSRPRHRR